MVIGMEMRTHAENYQKLMSENSDKVQLAFDEATKIAMDYRLSNVQDEFGGGYPLIDMLTLSGHNISEGKEEIELFLDLVVINVLMAYEGLLNSDT